MLLYKIAAELYGDKKIRGGSSMIVLGMRPNIIAREMTETPGPQVQT